MLSDEVIDKVIDRITNRIEETNTYVIKKMGESIKKIKTLTPTQAQQLSQIMRYGGDYDKIARALAKMSKLNVQEIYKIFEEIAKQDYLFAKQFYKYRNMKFIPYEKNVALQNQVNALATITAREYNNLTKTMGFAKIVNGRVVYDSIARTYQNILDKAVLSVSQGKDTFDNEMYRAIKELSDSGIKSIDYMSGRSYRLDNAVRTALQSGLRNLHMELQQQFGEGFDADGVEISVHINPAPDHELVQGKQFSNEEFDKFQNDMDAMSYDGILFPAESEETGHDRRSIGQYNCYHYIFPIILGISKPRYTNEELDNIVKEANRKFTFDGKEYTKYEGTQLQRKLELELRKAKDNQIGNREADTDKAMKAQKRINMLTKKYNDLLKASGLKSKIERARVSGYHKISVNQ